MSRSTYFCTNCGRHSNINWKFCKHCGAEVVQDEDTKQETETDIYESKSEIMPCPVPETSDLIDKPLPGQTDKQPRREEDSNFIAVVQSVNFDSKLKIRNTSCPYCNADIRLPRIIADNYKEFQCNECDKVFNFVKDKQEVRNLNVRESCPHCKENIIIRTNFKGETIQFDCGNCREPIIYSKGRGYLGKDARVRKRLFFLSVPIAYLIALAFSLYSARLYARLEPYAYEFLYGVEYEVDYQAAYLGTLVEFTWKIILQLIFWFVVVAVFLRFKNKVMPNRYEILYSFYKVMAIVAIIFIIAAVFQLLLYLLY